MNPLPTMSPSRDDYGPNSGNPPPPPPNAYIDPQILYGLHEPRYRSYLKYDPDRVHVLEIAYPIRGSPKTQVFRLGPTEFEEYLRGIDQRGEMETPALEAVTTDAVGLGKLRIILGRAGARAAPDSKTLPLEFPRDVDSVGSSGLGAFARHHHTAVPVPFSQLHYDMVLQKFGLPRATSISLRAFDLSSHSSLQLSDIESCWIRRDTATATATATAAAAAAAAASAAQDPQWQWNNTTQRRYNPHYQPHRSETELDITADAYERVSPKRLGIKLSFMTSTLIEFEMGLSMSWCPRSNTTSAWVYGRHTTRQAAMLERDIVQLAAVASHPLLLPYVLCLYLKSSIDRQIFTCTGKLFSVEAESGQSGIVLVGRNGVIAPGNCDDPELSKRATGISQIAIALTAHCQNLLLTLQQLRASVPRINAAMPHRGVRRLIFMQQSSLLDDMLGLLEQKARLNLLKISSLKERAQVQSSAIYNHLAHRANEINVGLAESSRIIAIDAKRDSSSMKSIAVLTMIFLPGTYIATLFSTPGIQNLNPTLALYFLVTIPITGFTLFFWFGWNWRSTNQINLPGAEQVIGRKISSAGDCSNPQLAMSPSAAHASHNHHHNHHGGDSGAGAGHRTSLAPGFSFLPRKSSVADMSLHSRGTSMHSLRSPSTFSPSTSV